MSVLLGTLITAAPAGIAGILLTWLAITSTAAAIGTVLVASFSIGIFQLAGIPELVPKAIAEYLALILFLKAIYIRTRRHGGTLNLFAAVPILGVVIVGVVSGLAHGLAVMPIVLFLRQQLRFYLFFFAVLNLDIRRSTVNRLLLLVVVLFAFQIPASWIKLVVWGVDERWIGTVHRNAGELSVLLPLVAVSFLFASYLYKRRPRYLLWIVFFYLFSVIGEKEAGVFLFPALLLFMLVYYNATRWPSRGRWPVLSGLRRSFAVNRITLVVAAALVFFFLGARLIPRLRAMEDTTFATIERLGSFNPRAVAEVALVYVSRGLDEVGEQSPSSTEPIGLGRLAWIIVSIDRVVNADRVTTLIGYGGGSMFSGYLGGGQQNFVAEEFGVRGATPAAVSILLETGLLGLAFMSFFYLRFYQVLTQRLFSSRDPAESNLALWLLGMHAVFLLDFLIYSRATMYVGVLTPCYFLLLALFIKGSVTRAPTFHWRGARLYVRAV